MNRLIVDFDGTISLTEEGNYKNSLPNIGLVEKLRKNRNLSRTFVNIKLLKLIKNTLINTFKGKILIH